MTGRTASSKFPISKLLSKFPISLKQRKTTFLYSTGFDIKSLLNDFSEILRESSGRRHMSFQIHIVIKEKSGIPFLMPIPERIFRLDNGALRATHL